MGMFDTFKMSGILLPDMSYSDEGFQTKNFDCNLDQYVVTPDGRVQKRVMDVDTILYEPTRLTGSCILLGNKHELRATFESGRLISLEIMK